MTVAVIENGGLGEYRARMSDSLMQASHTLSLIEKRVLMMALAKAGGSQSHSACNHFSQPVVIRVTALEYASTYGVDPKNAYSHLKKAAEQLFERQFSIKVPSKCDQVMRCRWVSSVGYVTHEGLIALSFTPDVCRHLNALRQQYTSYKLKNASGFKSAYSWRLYEVAESWLAHSRKGKVVRISLSHLQQQLQWPESYRWNDARKRAISPAVDEINRVSKLNVSYAVIKNGRSVHALDFTFKPNNRF